MTASPILLPPDERATPDQVQALKNIILYDFGMVEPKDFQLKAHGYKSLNDWYMSKFARKSGIALKSFDYLDKETASLLINDLQQ